MSSNDLMLDVSQAHELKMAFRRNGWTNADIKDLSKGKFLLEVLKLLKGQVTTKPVEYFIDCNVAPFIPKDWIVVQHRKGGIIRFDITLFSLYLSKKTEEGRITGQDLLNELTGMSMMNANVLDFLLAHPRLIPEKFKSQDIWFLGTIYRDTKGRSSIRCLNWDGTEWGWCYRHLGDELDYSNAPVALEKK